MKKMIVVTVFAVAVMNSACGLKMEIAPPTTVTESTAVEVASTAAVSIAANTEQKSSLTPIEETTANTDVNNEHPYYGTWVVKSCLGDAETFAMSAAEIDEMIGTSLTYGSDTYSINGNDEHINGYTEGKSTSDEFIESFGISFADLGIESQQILSVSINVEGNYFGDSFYMTDDDNLVIYHEGIFFNAERGER